MTLEFMQQVEHRPWPVPNKRWNFFQSWRNLLFAHYRVPVETLRPLIPEPLELDTFDGYAYVGIVPFFLVVHPRYSPPLPRLSFFPEINVRTYVTYQGKPGVWFLSLDARSPIAVWAARRFFSLPYYHAAMKMKPNGEWIEFHSRRLKAVREEAQFNARYRPKGPIQEAQPDSLEHFLAERYCLYAVRPKGETQSELLRVDVHHAIWPLQLAEAEIDRNSMAMPRGIELSAPPDYLHFAKQVDVAVWPIETLIQLDRPATLD